MGNIEGGDLWQHYRELQEIVGDSNSSKKWLRLTVIAHQISRDSKVAKRCLSQVYFNRLTNLKRKLNANKWYTSGDFKEAKNLLDHGCPQLEEGIDYEALGLNWYRAFAMRLSYFPGMDDCNHTNQLRTISSRVPPADHEIPVPPLSPDKSKMLPPPIPPNRGNEKENHESNVGGRLTDLAEDGSEDETSTPTKKNAGSMPPAPTEKDADTMPAVPTENEAVITLRTPTWNEGGTASEKSTEPERKVTPQPDQPATPGSESSSSDDDTKGQYMSCFTQWLGLDLGCKKMSDYKTKMLAHHERRMESTTVPIFQ